MMKKLIYPIVSVLLLAAAACSDDKKQEEPTSPTPPEPEKVVVELTEAEKSFMEQITRPCARLFGMLCDDASTKNENIVVAPLATVEALHILEDDINLGEYSLVPFEILQIYKSLIMTTRDIPEGLYEKLSQLDPAVAVSSANALFCDEDFFENCVIKHTDGSGVAVGIVEAPKSDKDPTMADYVNDWLSTHLTNTVGFYDANLKDYPTLVSSMKFSGAWGGSTLSVGTGLQLQYREKAEVLTGEKCYAVRVPLGTEGAYEALVIKANPGVDINDAIASGEVFTIGGGTPIEKPFTVGFPMGTVSTSPNISLDKIMAKLLEGFDYERYNADGLSKPMTEVMKFYSLGMLSFSKSGMTAGGGSSASVTSRSSEGLESGFINVADGNCVILVYEKSSGGCILAARIAAV